PDQGRLHSEPAAADDLRGRHQPHPVGGRASRVLCPLGWTAEAIGRVPLFASGLMLCSSILGPAARKRRRLPQGMRRTMRSVHRGARLAFPARKNLYPCGREGAVVPVRGPGVVQADAGGPPMRDPPLPIDRSPTFLPLLGWLTGAVFFFYAWVLRVAPSVMV